MDYQTEKADRPSRQAMSGVTCEATPLDKLLSEFRNAKVNFDAACENAAASQMQRDKAEGYLRGLANQLDRALGKVLLDPTNPKISAGDGPEQPPRF